MEGRPGHRADPRRQERSMEEIVGEALAKRLIAWGVDTVFGLPGDGINGLMEGFRRCRDDIEFFLVHHEEAAAFMATGYGKGNRSTGRLLRDLGAGRDSSAERPVRRQTGSR